MGVFHESPVFAGLFYVSPQLPESRPKLCCLLLWLRLVENVITTSPQGFKPSAHRCVGLLPGNTQAYQPVEFAPQFFRRPLVGERWQSWDNALRITNFAIPPCRRPSLTVSVLVRRLKNSRHTSPSLSFPFVRLDKLSLAQFALFEDRSQRSDFEPRMVRNHRVASVRVFHDRMLSTGSSFKSHALQRANHFRLHVGVGETRHAASPFAQAADLPAWPGTSTPIESPPCR